MALRRIQQDIDEMNDKFDGLRAVQNNPAILAAMFQLNPALTAAAHNSASSCASSSVRGGCGGGDGGAYCWSMFDNDLEVWHIEYLLILTLISLFVIRHIFNFVRTSLFSSHFMWRPMNLVINTR